MIELSCLLTKMLPAHPAVCLIDHRHQLPPLCSKTRNNRAMLRGRPQERRRALLGTSVVPGAPGRDGGGCLSQTDPFPLEDLRWSLCGDNLLLCWFLLWGWGQCVWRCYHSYHRNQDSIQKTESHYWQGKGEFWGQEHQQECYWRKCGDDFREKCKIRSNHKTQNSDSVMPAHCSHSKMTVFLRHNYRFS